jgi:hypothetical protein
MNVTTKFDVKTTVKRLIDDFQLTVSRRNYHAARIRYLSEYNNITVFTQVLKGDQHITFYTGIGGSVI